MMLLLVVIGTLLTRPALLLNHNHCGINVTHDSPLLHSLQCHNDYESYVHCQWTEESHHQPPLQLWFLRKDQSVLCPPHGPAVLRPDGRRTVQCRYRTKSFSISTEYTAFFRGQEISCAAQHTPVDLSEHLQALPPQRLASKRTDFGDYELHWASPYPEPMGKNMTYQLNYRSQREDEWTKKLVTQPDVRLLKQSLRAGHTYEARVRGRTSVSQWSSWSPVLTWRTEEGPDSGQHPRLRCVLTGEESVSCSWDVNRAQDQIISYQLACRDNQSSLSTRCCVNSSVQDSGRKVTYSCTLMATDPAHLHLELVQKHKANSFKAHKHIRPNPPKQLEIKAKDGNWLVKWTKPNTSPDIQLLYQVCYNRTDFQFLHQDCSEPFNVSNRFLNILDSSLIPSYSYRVQVRSVVQPGQGSLYEGTPSEWTQPAEWTSHAAGWSLSNVVYSCVGVLVVAVFLAIYFTIPACHRRAVLWSDSVPSPRKSRIISELKFSSKPHVLLSEKTFICAVQRLEKPPCDSVVVSHKDVNGGEWGNRGYWSSENSPSQESLEPHLSAMGFSGPYIFCEPNFAPEATERTETSEEAYVCLPSSLASRWTPDLVSQDRFICNCRDSDPKCPDIPEARDGALTHSPLNEPTSSDPYVAGPFTSWPSIKASGYCSLPANEVK